MIAYQHRLAACRPPPLAFGHQGRGDRATQRPAPDQRRFMASHCAAGSGHVSGIDQVQVPWSAGHPVLLSDCALQGGALQASVAWLATVGRRVARGLEAAVIAATSNMSI